LDAPVLITIANQTIIALVLPKRLAAPLKQQVGSFRGGRLERAWKLGYARLRSEQKMDVMGHDHPRVQLVVPDFRSVPDRSEPALHRDEGFAGSRIRGRKGALCRKTVVQAEGDEQRLAGDIEMREPGSSQGHDWIVRAA
jgi:hypothetical protein